jgi:methionyl-tRNA synthetase
MRTISGLADECNRYFDQAQPWVMIKTDPEATRVVLTAIVNAVRILAAYLKPIVPGFSEKVEKFLNIEPLCFADVDSVIEEHTIDKFVRLVERVDKEKVEAMVEESKEEQAPETPAVETVELDEPIEAECTIDDFMKVDLRVAEIELAEAVEGANKLLHLRLNMGALKKDVFAGISKAYKPEELVGRKVVCVANLKPRKMKFGISEGMVCAAGPGGAEVFLLSVDSGAKPGDRIH